MLSHICNASRKVSLYARSISQVASVMLALADKNVIERLVGDGRGTERSLSSLLLKSSRVPTIKPLVYVLYYSAIEAREEQKGII